MSSAEVSTRSPSMSRLSPRGWRPGPALLGLFSGWMALWAWSGMVARPASFLAPSLLLGLVMVLAGSWLRATGAPSAAVVPLQLLIAGLGLNAASAGGESLLGLVPTGESLRRLAYAITDGATTLNHYAAPVVANPTHTRAMLLACGLAVLLCIDVLAMSLRRPPLIALPLLVTLSVPVSILRDPLALPVFVGTALLFLRLLAVEHLDRLREWGAADRHAASARREPVSTRPALTTLWLVSIAAVLAALVLAPFVPVAHLLDRTGGDRASSGGSNDFQLTATNPFIHLQRDLVKQTHTPMLYAGTNAQSTGYLHTTVLDEFTSDSWRPSQRDLPGSNKADGVFPSPPGLAPGVGFVEERWSLQLAPGFATTWLPLPYPLRRLQVTGSWRYDSRTLDVASISDGAPSQLRYSATAISPTITAELLRSSPTAPARIRAPMTAVPDNLPEVIKARALAVTRGARTDYDKAVALQSWFRKDGGFRYSLEQRNGSGMDLLADFVTGDRVGYCEQFASAMAAMGRTLNIPSRVVVGFLDGTAQPDGRLLYTSDDRHAWPEMYFSGVGWVRFEPTPAQRTGASPVWTRQTAATTPSSTVPRVQASPRSAPVRNRIPSQATIATDRGSWVPWWSALVLPLVVALGLAPAVLRRAQRRRRLAAADPVHLVEGAWAELRATALDLGLDWPEERSPREQARRVVDQVHTEASDLAALEGLLVRVELGRYARSGGVGTASRERTRTVETVAAWRRVMATSVNRQHGWWATVWPRSLVRGPGSK